MTVIAQNDSCRKVCGNMAGKICSKGCMQQLNEMPPESLKANSFITLKNVLPDEGVINALMLNNNGFVTTLVFDITKNVDEQLLAIEPYGLTYTEGQIVRMMLEGATNAEIVKKFRIARSTLKSHINNIYRKLPVPLRNEIMAKRSSSSLAVATEAATPIVKREDAS
jgi:DNA-binding CsgD family transcriptional regulator